jgi:hypothetical protein
MKKSELRQIIKEEINRYKTTSKDDPNVNKFLRLLNYQPFDDWYKKYDYFISGDEVDDDFFEETLDIMNWLKKITQQ